MEDGRAGYIYKLLEAPGRAAQQGLGGLNNDELNNN
jgi:hypothetical protein